MSTKEKKESVVSSVVTRSQASKKKNPPSDKAEEVVERISKTANKKTVRERKSQASKTSSILNMGLFEDWDRAATAESELSSESGEDVSSVDSKLHVSLEEVNRKLKTTGLVRVTNPRPRLAPRAALLGVN